MKIWNEKLGAPGGPNEFGLGLCEGTSLVLAGTPQQLAASFLSSWKARIIAACYLISAITCQQEKQKYHY